MPSSVKKNSLLGLNDFLKALTDHIEDSAIEIKRGVALNVLKEVSDQNPEDTGYSEYNWQASGTKIHKELFSYIPNSKVYAIAYNSGLTISRNEVTISNLGARLGEPIYIGNSVNYLNMMPYKADQWVPIGIDNAIRKTDKVVSSILKKF